MSFTYDFLTLSNGSSFNNSTLLHRIEDNVLINQTTQNPDYNAYLAWVALGNTAPTVASYPYYQPVYATEYYSDANDATLQTQVTSVAATVATFSALTAATQAQMEAASSNIVFATPAHLQNHPAVAKAWVSFSSAGAIESSYNIASVVKNSTGLWTISYTVPFSSASYNPIFTAELTIAALLSAGVKAGTKLAGSIQVSSATLLGILADPSGKLYFAAYGDQ